MAFTLLHDYAECYIHRLATLFYPAKSDRAWRDSVLQLRIRSVSMPTSGLGAASIRVAAPDRPGARRATPSAAGIGAGPVTLVPGGLGRGAMIRPPIQQPNIDQAPQAEIG